MFIDTIGWDGRLLKVAANRVMGIVEHTLSKPGAPVTLLIMACGNESEEWNVRETVAVISAKIVAVTEPGMVAKLKCGLVLVQMRSWCK